MYDLIFVLTTLFRSVSETVWCILKCMYLDKEWKLRTSICLESFEVKYQINAWKQSHSECKVKITNNNWSHNKSHAECEIKSRRITYSWMNQTLDHVPMTSKHTLLTGYTNREPSILIRYNINGFCSQNQFLKNSLKTGVKHFRLHLTQWEVLFEN